MRIQSRIEIDRLDAEREDIWGRRRRVEEEEKKKKRKGGTSRKQKVLRIEDSPGNRTNAERTVPNHKTNNNYYYYH